MRQFDRPRVRRPHWQRWSNGMTVQIHQGVVVVTGELDRATAPTLAAALVPLIEVGGQLRIDTRQLTYIGAAGLHVLDDAAHAIGDHGRVVVFDPSPIMLRAIGLVNAQRVVDVIQATPRQRHRIPRNTSPSFKRIARHTS
jgi:anti-anti-sigma factor